MEVLLALRRPDQDRREHLLSQQLDRQIQTLDIHESPRTKQDALESLAVASRYGRINPRPQFALSDCFDFKYRDGFLARSDAASGLAFQFWRRGLADKRRGRRPGAETAKSHPPREIRFHGKFVLTRLRSWISS